MIYPIFLALITILFGFIAWKDLKLGLSLLIGLLPIYLLRFSIGPLPSTMLEVLIFVTFVIWILKTKPKKPNLHSLTPFDRAILLLLAAASFGVVIASDTIGALGIWKAYFIEPALVYVMLKSTFKTEKDWMMPLKAIGISAMIISILGTLQFFTQIGIPAPWDIERRITSIYAFPNAVGLFLAPIAAMSTVFIFKTKNELFWFSVTLLSVIAITLAKTEAALVAIPAALLLSLLASNTNNKLKQRITVEAILIFLVTIIAIPLVRAKIFLQDYSGQVRLSQWSETLTLLKHNIPFGVGLNEYPTALEPFHDPTIYEIFQYPHNIFLNTWVELGLLGLFTLIWLGLITIKIVKRHNTNPLILGAFAALATMAIHGLVDVPFFKNDLAVLTFFFIALMSSVAMLRVDEKKKRA